MIVSPSASFSLRNEIYQKLLEHPEWVPHLWEMVRWEHEYTDRYRYPGWIWEDVHTKRTIVDELIAEGIVSIVSKSKTYRFCLLEDLEATVGALEDLEIAHDKGDDGLNINDLFQLVVGHSQAKNLLRLAVEAHGPVHVLLTGPPGTAKTLMLSDIARLKGGAYYAGSTTTKSGLVTFLLDIRPRYMVLDELDKMANVDMSPLLNLMEGGIVSRLQFRARERIELDTQIFAGANDLRRIPEPIVSRFARVEIPPYTPQEFLHVAQEVLPQHPKTKAVVPGPEMGKLIAGMVVAHSTDIRDAFRVAQMARGEPHLVQEVVNCLWPRRGPTKPITLMK